MRPATPRPLHSVWKLALAALLVAAALLPATASAKMTGSTNTYFVAGGTSPVKGINVTGYAGKNVLVSLSTSVGTLKIDGPCLSTYITPAYGYTTSGSALLFSGPYECVRQVLSGLTLTTPQPAQKVTKPGVATTPVTIKGMATEYRADLTFNAASQHFYKYVAAANTPWRDVGSTTGANTLAGASTELGLAGYLATISDADENNFVANKIQGASGQPAKNVWIGANDIATEGTWIWAGGPEKDVQFWQGAETGSAVAGRYSSWASGEPNNYPNGGTYDTGENCAVINKLDIGASVSRLVSGLWNDLPCNIGAVGVANTIEGYIIEYGNKAVGGDYQNVDLVESAIKRELPVTNITTPNVLDKLFNLLFVSKKAKPLPKKPKKPATFTVTLKIKMNEAGTYSVTVKRPDGKGIPFAFQPGSKYKSASSKQQTANSERWNIIITTKKDNETVTINPILKNADWVKPKDTKLFFRLVASKKDQENQMCMANWCQGAKIPVVKG